MTTKDNGNNNVGGHEVQTTPTGEVVMSTLDVQISTDAKEMAEILSCVKFNPSPNGLNIGLERINSYDLSDLYGNAEDIRKVIRNLPGYGKRIQFVDVMKFPFVRLSTEHIRQVRSYTTEIFKIDDRPDLLTLKSNKNKYKNPWTDGAFPACDDKAVTVELADSCELVKCDQCYGKGHASKKCEYCHGTGVWHGDKCCMCDGRGYFIKGPDGKEVPFDYSCQKCGGSGKVKQVLIATQNEKEKVFSECGVWMCDGWKENIPNVGWSNERGEFSDTFELAGADCSSALNHKVLLDVESRDGRVDVSDVDIPGLPISGSEINQRLADYWSGYYLSDSGTDVSRCERIFSERIRVEYGIRFARIHLKLYVSDEWIRSYSGDKDLVRQAARNARYWSDPKASLRDAYVWVDVLNGKVWELQWIGEEPRYPGVPLEALILRIGDAMGLLKFLDPISPNGSPKTKDTSSASKKSAGSSQKKRWKFALLGLLFGWFGAHFMYAKRWLMLLLMLGSFATGVVMMNKSESNQKEVPVQTEQQTEGDASKGNSEAIGAVCLVLWLVMWLGGALFVKKDGKGNRM